MNNLPSFEGNGCNGQETNGNTLTSAVVLHLSNVGQLVRNVNCLRTQLGAQATVNFVVPAPLTG